jgi:serine/threonine protein kinase
MMTPLDPYHLKIGSGTYGAVYKKNDQNVYKVMEKYYEKTDEPCDVTLRELYTICSLNNPHIISPHEVSVHTNRVIMHMKHGGITLNDWIFQTSSSDRASFFWSIMSQIITTCMYLKKQGVQQIDMRPNNILVQMKDDVPFVTLIDFGLVSYKYPHSSNWSEAYGCWVYCPPEVFEEQSTIYDTSSVWEIAMVGCYILMKANPFQESIGENVDHSSFNKCKSHMLKKIKGACSTHWELTPFQQNTMEHTLGETWPTWLMLFQHMTRWKPQDRMTFEQLFEQPLLDYHLHMHRSPSFYECTKNFVDTPKIYGSVITHNKDTYVHIHTWMTEQCSDMWLPVAKNLMDRFVQRCCEVGTLLTIQEAMDAALACLATTNYVFDLSTENQVQNWITHTQSKQTVAFITKWIWYIGSMCYWQLF